MCKRTEHTNPIDRTDFPNHFASRKTMMLSGRKILLGVKESEREEKDNKKKDLRKTEDGDWR